MRKLYFILVLFLALAAAGRLSAQTPVLPDHFAKWSKTPAVRDAKILPPAEYAEIWREAGSASVELAEYDSGSAKLDATLGKYRDPTSAYEVYTAYLNPSMHATVLNRTSAVDGDRMLVLLGSFILQVRPVQAISAADLATFANLVGAHADPAPLPPIRRYLPKGFLDGTQKYAQGPSGFQNAFAALKRGEFAVLADEAGFASGAEAMVAEYRSRTDSAGLLLIEYPTPQLAEQHLKHLEQALSPAAKQAGTTIERKGSLLSIVLRPSSPAFAETLRGGLNYETEVTWNEPGQTITPPQMLGVVGKILIITMMFMVVAVVLGVAFGGVRVLAKTFFPGRFFDRPEQMDVLQLGLSGKRIDSRDFY
jgi:hypothetical protein